VNLYYSLAAKSTY